MGLQTLFKAPLWLLALFCIPACEITYIQGYGEWQRSNVNRSSLGEETFPSPEDSAVPEIESPDVTPTLAPTSTPTTPHPTNPPSESSDIIWNDDFETVQTLNSSYKDLNLNGLSLAQGIGINNSRGIEQRYTKGQVDAGWLIRLNTNGYPEHLFMRWYHKFQAGFEGFPPKMARLRYRIRSGNWDRPLAIHAWLTTSGEVVMDVKAVDSSNANDAGWLPVARSYFTFADPKNIGRWVPFEMEVKLNTPGKRDGLYRLYIDGQLRVERVNVDLRGTKNYKMNEAMLDCYWNEGSPKVQSRYYDNFTISTSRIGPID